MPYIPKNHGDYYLWFISSVSGITKIIPYKRSNRVYDKLQYLNLVNELMCSIKKANPVGMLYYRVVASRQSSIGTIYERYAVPTELILYYRLPETYISGNNMCCLWQQMCNLSTPCDI